MARAVRVIAMLAGFPARASAGGWVCVLDQAPVEPAPANRGAVDCKEAAGGGGFAPVLPIPVQASALTANTALAGPIAGPPQDPAATAASSLADIRVDSLLQLPIDLPDPDFSDVDAISVPGFGTIDRGRRSRR